MSDTALEKLAMVNYPVKLYFDEADSLYVVEFLDLPGCHAFGETVEEAYKKAQGAKKEWIRVSLEQGLPIPKPSKEVEHSGRLLLRLPPSLHSVLSDKAKMEGVSLNTYVLHLASSALVVDQVSDRINLMMQEISQLKHRIAGLAANLDRLVLHRITMPHRELTQRMFGSDQYTTYDTNEGPLTDAHLLLGESWKGTTNTMVRK